VSLVLFTWICIFLFGQDAFAQTSTREQTTETYRAALRLPPSAFPELPDSIRQWLETGDYRVSQSACERGSPPGPSGRPESR
jgi:hypothetical protein